VKKWLTGGGVETAGRKRNRMKRKADRRRNQEKSLAGEKWRKCGEREKASQSNAAKEEGIGMAAKGAA